VGNRRNEFAFHPKDPDQLVPLALKVPRHVKEKIVRQAREAGVTQSEWCTAALEQAALRRFRVQCFHPEHLVVNDWCLLCKTWIGWDSGEEDHGGREGS